MWPASRQWLGDKDTLGLRRQPACGYQYIETPGFPWLQHNEVALNPTLLEIEAIGWASIWLNTECLSGCRRGVNHDVRELRRVKCHRGLDTPLLIVDGYSCFYMAVILVATLGCATLSHAYLEGYPGNREELYLLLTLACASDAMPLALAYLRVIFIAMPLKSGNPEDLASPPGCRLGLVLVHSALYTRRFSVLLLAPCPALGHR